MVKITKQIAEAMGCVYVYDDWGRINIFADKVKTGKTMIAEVLPAYGVIDTTFAPITRVEKRQIFAFLKHVDLDFKGDEVGTVIDEMLDVAKIFVRRLDDSGVYDPQPGKLEYNCVIDFLDANMAGVRLTLTLKETQGECVE